MAFASRVRCHSQWQNAESELRRVKQSYERARNQGRIPPERMGHSLAQIAEVRHRHGLNDLPIVYFHRRSEERWMLSMISSGAADS